MTCEQMKLGVTNASAGKSSNGACSAESPGCTNGSPESQSIEVLRWPPLYEPSAMSSGVEAIEAWLATGDDDDR